MSYSPSQILIDQVTEYLTEQLGRAPTAAEILNGLVAPWTLGNIHNVLQVPSSFLSIVPGQDIQEAIDKLEANGGGILDLTPGTYTVDYDIEIPSNVTVQGTNRDAVVIDFDGGAFSVKLYGTIGTPTTGIAIRTLTIQNSTAPGIDVSYSNDFNIYNINVFDCQYGLKVANSNFPTIELPFFDGCGYGASLTDVTGYLFSGAVCDNSVTGYGLSLVRASNASVYNAEMVGNATHGIYMDESEGVAFSSISVTDNGSDGVHLLADVSENQFGSMVIKDNGAYGINIMDSTSASNIILGNFFSGNTTAAADDNGTGTLIRSNVGLADN